MTGPLAESHRSLPGVVAADASLERIELDYDAVRLFVTETNGDRKTITCRGHIGFQIAGFWDEVIIDSMAILKDHPFLIAAKDRCARTPTGELAPSGNPARNEGTMELLRVLLIDGCEVLIVAAAFETIG